jgi:hypothetical protein
VTRARAVAWVSLLVWAAWLFALQGLFASSRVAGSWVPDLGLLLLLALEGRLREGGRLPQRRLLVAALVIALARAAFSSDPPLALAAGYLGVAGVLGALRQWVELDHPFARATLAGGAALALGAFWILSAELPNEVLRALPWEPALATAAAAVVVLPALGRLPGLTPLARARA